MTDHGVTKPQPSQPPEPVAADGELTDRRTEYTRTFRDDDGSLRAVIGSQPLNVPDADGDLAPIDTRLVPVAAADASVAAGTVIAPDAAFVTASGATVLSVPEEADGTVRVSDSDGTWVQAELLDGSGSPMVENSTATAVEALPGVDVSWTSTVAGLKESLTLKSPGSTNTSSYLLSLSAGLIPVLSHGQIQALNSAGTAVWTMPAPFMDDAAGAHSDAVAYDLERTAAGWQLTMTADKTWLAAPERTYPVVVDPTILLSAAGTGFTQDLACALQSDLPTVSSCTGSSFDVGASSGSVDRAAIRFPRLNQQLRADAVLAVADLHLPITADTGGPAITLEARSLTGPFTSAATWNTKDAAYAWAGGAGALGQSTSSAGTVAVPSTSAVGTDQTISLTGLGQAWLSGQTGNYGILLKGTNDSSMRKLTIAGLTATCTASTACGTHLEVAYQLRLGAYQGSQTFGVPLTDQTDLSVNYATGNGFVTADDLGFSRVHNSQRSGTTTQLGQGWFTASGNNVTAFVDQPAGSLRYYGPGSTMYVFLKNADGTFESPPGIAAVATVLGSIKTIRFERSGTTLTFGANGLLTKSADRNGNTTTFAYVDPTNSGAGDRQITSTITDPTGRVLTATNSGTRVTSLRDVSGRTVTFGYTATGVGDQLTSVTDAAGGVTKYEYDSGSRIVRITTPAGRVTRLTYDSSSRVLSVIRVTDPAGNGGAGAGPTTNFSYTPITASTTATPSLTPAARGTTVVTDPRGNKTTYQHDSASQITTVTDALGRHRDSTYGLDGNVIAAYDAMGVGTATGNPTTYTYDSLFNPTGVTAPTGAAAKAYYSASAGNCTTTDTAHPFQAKCLTGTDGSESSVIYDGPGNVTSTTTTTSTGGSITKTLTYQGAGGASCGGRPGQVCASTDGNGNKTTFGYDAAGNLITVTPPTVTTGTQLGKTTIAYDSLGRTITVTDGKGQVTAYGYDATDHNTLIQYPGGSTVQSTFDEDGNLIATSDSSAGTKTFIYDDLGRQTATKLADGTSASITWDSAGNTLTYTDPSGTVTYTFDAVNQLMSLAEPGGDCTTSPGTKCTRFSYNANGARTSVTYPGATSQTTTVDDSGRPTRIVATSPAGSLSDVEYSYTDATAGAAFSTDRSIIQRRTENISITGEPAGNTQRYSYDTLDHLTDVKEYPSTNSTTTSTSWNYTYDNQGNRTSARFVTSSNNSYTSWAYNEVDQLINRSGDPTGWLYDANGNQTSSPGSIAEKVPTRTAVMNARDQLASITTLGIGAETTAFGYFANSNNDRTSSGASTFTNALLGASATTTSGATTAYTRTPDGALVSQRLTNGTSRYYLTDSLGSTIGLVNGVGVKTASYSYDPYGQARTTTGADAATNPYRYTGGHLDITTGLYKLGYRYYDPSEGRFTQLDPSGVEDNGYLYASGNPVSLKDPSGLASIDGGYQRLGGFPSSTRIRGGIREVKTQSGRWITQKEANFTGNKGGKPFPSSANALEAAMQRAREGGTRARLRRPKTPGENNFRVDLYGKNGNLLETEHFHY